MNTTMHHHQNDPFQSKYLIPIAITVGGLILAVAVYMAIPKQPNQNAGDASIIRSVDSTDHVLGNPAAKVIIVEYSDFDCQYCKLFNDTMHQIIANEGAKGEVAWVYRHFPLIEIHPNAMSHARASECVAQVAGNDVFWKFETALFDRQPVDPLEYGALAKAAGVTGDGFAKCYANAGSPSSSVDAQILRDRQNALDMGAKGTPYSVILVAGKPPVIMNGNYPYTQVKQLIDQALAQ